jgi:hypothetical protein
MSAAAWNVSGSSQKGKTPVLKVEVALHDRSTSPFIIAIFDL